MRKAMVEVKNSKKEFKAVLVDIFARDENCFIKLENKLSEIKVPKIHITVLYFQLENPTIPIIDPNNSKHSQHIADSSTIIFLKSQAPTKILSSVHKLEIYTPQRGNIGPNFNQYRDCTDIAVKLAFKLNNLQENLDHKAIDKAKAVIAISNNPLITGISFNFNNIPVRIKQALNDVISDSLNKIFEVVIKHIKFYIELRMIDISSDLEENIISKLTIQDEH